MLVKITVIIITIALFVSISINIYQLVVSKKLDNSITQPIIIENKYQHLSPRLVLSDKNDIYLNFSSLRYAIREYIKSQNKPIFFHFEYLPSGSTIGVNDQEQLPSASLIKIPTVMAIYKKIEENKLTFDTVLTVSKNDIDPSFGTFWKEGIGTSITVRDAIEKTIIDSDNTTHNLLYNLLDREDVEDIFNQLDILLKKDGIFDSMYVSVKSYTSILKSLYYSTYLNYESSNDILGLLKKVKDNSKLPAGIPSDIPIAHKTGIYERVPGEYFYHDCGIVYSPKRSYVLCIMMNGTEDEATFHIKELSRMVYNFIQKIDIPTSIKQEHNE